MASRSTRTRGAARRKFLRAAAEGREHERRVEFGKTWGAFNSAFAKQLRAGAR